MNEENKKWEQEFDDKERAYLEKLAAEKEAGPKAEQEPIDEETMRAAERLAKYGNVETGRPGEDFWGLKNRLAEDGWERRSEVNMDVAADLEAILKEELGNEHYWIVISARKAYVFTRRGDHPDISAGT